MQNGDAELSVFVDVGVKDGANEAKLGRRHWVVPRHFEFGLEVRAVVEGGRIENNEGNIPEEEIAVLGLMIGVSREIHNWRGIKEYGPPLQPSSLSGSPSTLPSGSVRLLSALRMT